jgi:phage gp29-like protein
MIWADSGSLRLAADLVDSVLGDDRVQSVFSTRVGGLLGSEQSFEPSSNGHVRKRNRALKAIEAGADFWEIFDEAETTRLMIWGLALGVGFARLRPWTPHPDHNGRLLTRLEVWHPRWFRWSYDRNTWQRWTGGTTDWVDITPGDGEWVVYTPYGASRPWAYGLWRGLSVLWLLKRYAIRDWARRSEAHGQPAWLIESAESDDYQKRKELADLFGDLGRNPAIGMPRGFTAQLVEAAATTAEIFENQIRLANTGFAVNIVGGNLNVEVDGPVQTGSTAQTLVRIDYKRKDASSLSTLAHDQVLGWWAEWNFGEARLAPWPTWIVEPPADTAVVATTWLNVAKAAQAFRLAGYELDLAVTAERFDIPLTKVVVPVVDPNAPTAAADDPSADDAPPDEKPAKP